MSGQSETIILSIGALLILIGMMRLIFVNHLSPNNVNLVHWMLTGGLVEFVVGMFKGTQNILHLDFDSNAFAASLVYVGFLIIVFAL